ncbi:TIGR03089 family protein [Symbioplanes lichenis]|uniref:TIGR03089 family protein n=1 Tax=Symbioplanes lichenis TaxID=1629072 RepID=UPI002739340B|nr:TIGR03089 family protein [Actinoplanes lichenis]
MTETIPAALAAAVRRDPTVPLLTWYDDATGDRTELSGATLANWVSKTANLLADGAGLGPGDTAVVLLPPHWQTAAILLGAWSAGLAVTGAKGDILFTSPAGFEQAAAETTGDRYATGLLPLAMPLRELPPGFADYTVEVRQFGDHFTPVQPVTAADLALGDRTHGDIPAAERAAELGITPGSRVLIDAAVHPDPVDWLLAPLYAGASIVLCAHLDPSAVEKRVATEKVTVTLT